MENYQSGAFDAPNQNANLSHGFDDPSAVVQSDFDNVSMPQFYDESGNYRHDAFENLGGLHYMNYLHSHDDML